MRLTEKWHVAGDRLRSHNHALPYATLVIEGQYEEKRRGSADDCREGTVVFHEAGERHANRFGSRSTRLINITWIGSDAHDRFTLSGIARNRTARRLTREVARELSQPDLCTPIALESLAAEIVVLANGIERLTAGAPQWFAEVDERIRDEYLHPLSLRVLAEGAGVHRSHLARVFRERRGCTIGAFVRQLRIEWARERIRSGAPIADVALQAGFADQSHMTRCFRRVTGMTPMQSRRPVRS